MLRPKAFPAGLSLLCLLLVCGRASAIVAPPGTPADFTGQWSGTGWSMSTVGVYQWQGGVGSAVAVSAEYLLTVNHISVTPGDTWSPDGVNQYTVVSVSHPPAAGDGTPVDLTLVKLDHPLAHWETLYNGNLATNTSVIMIGHGLSGSTAGGDYFTWDTSSPKILRWGTNTIDLASGIGTDNGTFYSNGFAMWFDTTGSDYEAGYGEGDSGGGTFIKVGNKWELAGINAYVGKYTSYTYNRSYAVSVSSYYNWIINSMTVAGDANLDLQVSFADYQVLERNFGMTSGATWYDGDFNGDGAVNFADYQALEANFGKSTLNAPAGLPTLQTPQGGGPGVPEPACLALLLAALPALRKKRPSTKALNPKL